MTNERILTGTIDITDNLPFILDLSQNANPCVVIINLDEDNMQLKSSRNVLGGVELLPPPEALMAEIDGDEQTYDIIYNMHFDTEFVTKYVTCLIGALYIGKRIILYYPSLDPSENNTVKKLLEMFWKRYGIGIGIMGRNMGMYDITCTPIWLKMLYTGMIIGPIEFLAKYPIDAVLEAPIMDRLLNDIRPVSTDIKVQHKYIMSIWKHIKEKPNLQIPFYHI